MTKLRKHTAAIALAGLLALFGSACATDDTGTDTGDTEAPVDDGGLETEPMEETS